jgi:hypothetical protein
MERLVVVYENLLGGHDSGTGGHDRGTGSICGRDWKIFLGFL